MESEICILQAGCPASPQLQSPPTHRSLQAAGIEGNIGSLSETIVGVSFCSIICQPCDHGNVIEKVSFFYCAENVITVERETYIQSQILEKRILVAPMSDFFLHFRKCFYITGDLHFFSGSVTCRRRTHTLCVCTYMTPTVFTQGSAFFQGGAYFFEKATVGGNFCSVMSEDGLTLDRSGLADHHKNFPSSNVNTCPAKYFPLTF